MAEIFKNRNQNIEHVELSIAAHRMRFLAIAALFKHTIAGVQHRSVWPGLILMAYIGIALATLKNMNEIGLPY